MLELTGMMAIAGALIGSALLALFAGEAIITLVIRAMHAGVERAEQAAACQSGQPQAAGGPLSAPRARLERV